MKNRNLPTWEISLYCISWILGIIYSTHQVFVTGNKLASLYVNDLPDGWSFLSRRKDDTDEEWRTWIRFIMFTISPWMLTHYVGARIVNKVSPKILPLWYVLITSACIIVNYGFQPFTILFVQPILFYLLLRWTNSRLLIWFACYGLCFVFTHEKSMPVYSVTYEDLNFIIPTLMWIYLRCISYSLCVVEKRIFLDDCYSFFGYVFYLPCFFLGPVLLFDEFHEQIYDEKRKQSTMPFLVLFLQNIRYLFWIFFTELCLHYIYVNSFLDYFESFVQIQCENVWIMYGAGFFIGQFFFLKYTVVYGLALTWTRAEGYQTPDPPSCIAYVYLYSDMWRDFDKPLYRFMKRHIYEPCLDYLPPRTNLKKATISFLCFFFVYVWHGLDYSIFMWSFLNYFGIIVEMSARYLSSSKWYQHLRKWLGSQNERRLLGSICAPLIIISAISNFYFLGGASMAETYFNFIFIRGTKKTLLCLWLLLYVSCQVSMEIKARRKDEMFKLCAVGVNDRYISSEIFIAKKVR